MLNKCIIGIAWMAAATVAAQTAHRPPAVPLVANDPYFSIWSMGDRLNGVTTKHWTGQNQPMTGLLRVDGKTYRWMGDGQNGMEQKSVEVMPLHTRYVFAANGVELHVTFFTASFPQDLDVLSRPVTYLSWSVKSTDGTAHDVSLFFDVDPLIAVNDNGQPVTWSRYRAGSNSVLRVGSRDQQPVNKTGDHIRIDWGYFNVVVSDGQNAITEMSSNARRHFAASGTLSGNDDLDMPRAAASSGGSAAHLAVAFPLGKVSSDPVDRHVTLAYTDGVAIEYLNRRLRDYWQRNGMTESAMLIAAENDLPTLEKRGVDFDSALMRDMEKVGGPEYAYLTALVYRQTVAAHKLVADVDGTPMLFSKENDSNGCIDTVDVTYPSAPFFLFFNPKLLEAQLEPLMRYAALSRWKFPFAPHDLGTYPVANGQVYGGGELNEEDQMPVEESGNLLILVAAMEGKQGNWDFARRYYPQLKAWAEYLETKGLDPENQLSTDDFSGHLAHNANLSIKAIEALGAFAKIADGVGEAKIADHYRTLAHRLPSEWEKLALEGDHYKLAFNQPNTWSQKYNLVWDRLLDLNLFSPKVAATEWAFYSKQMQQYGLPLDNRKSFTKLDWEVWTATLSSDPKQFSDLIHRLVIWADNTPSRVPTTDWYDTITGRQSGFQARSVVGGVYIKALTDPAIVESWHGQK